jgi:hypothetical protein
MLQLADFERIRLWSEKRKRFEGGWGEWGNILIDAGKYNKIFSKGFFL